MVLTGNRATYNGGHGIILSEDDDMFVVSGTANRATGNLTDIHNYTIAATEAQMMTDLTVAVRDRAVEAFNEIMRMQL